MAVRVGFFLMRVGWVGVPGVQDRSSWNVVREGGRRVAAAVTVLSLVLVAAGGAQAADVPDTPGAPIPVGSGPFQIAITPDGATAYVTTQQDNAVTPITMATNTPDTPIPAGDAPVGVAITPDGTTAYVVNNGDNTVTPITLATIDPPEPEPEPEPEPGPAPAPAAGPVAARPTFTG